MKKPIKIIIKTFQVVATIFILAFFLVVCLQRFSNNKISILNYRMFTVISGSMKPKYDVGDVLIAKKKAPSKIKVGDAISYKGVSGDFYNKVITHEVVAIEQNSKGKYVFHTRGISNLVEDPLVYESQLYGVVVYKSLILSVIYRLIASNTWFYFFIIISVLYIVGHEMIAVLLNKEKKRREKSNNDL